MKRVNDIEEQLEEIEKPSKIEKPHKTKSNKKPKPRKKLVWLILKLLFIATFIWMIFTFIFGIFRLSGNNMYPALKDGDLCITYRLDDYYNNDVVAYKSDKKTKIGRIIAREGDIIDGDEKGLLLNGVPINEEIFYPTSILDTNLSLPITLKKDEFIILNDYRIDMTDSRTYGIIDKDSLKGKIIFIFRRRGF